MQLFPLRKVKIVVSDFHLGKGKYLPDGTRNLLEDFTHDRQFIDFLQYHLEGPFKRCEMELVINGDFFNLLQVEYGDQFTDFITEGDSLHKLMKILEGHAQLFKKLAQFCQAPRLYGLDLYRHWIFPHLNGTYLCYPDLFCRKKFTKTKTIYFLHGHRRFKLS